MSPEKAPEQAVMLVVARDLRGPSKWCLLRCLASILLPVVHLFEKLLRLLLIDEGESRKTLLQLESVKEDAVLVVAPIFEDLLVPYYSAISGLRDY